MKITPLTPGPQGHNTAQIDKILATWQRILESLAQEMEE